MTKTKVLIVIAAAMLAASCTPVDVPPPAVVPQGDDRFLIDPRTGFTGVVPPKFENAWRYVLAGNELEAQRRLSEILAVDPSFHPAILAEAALDIRAGRFSTARERIARARDLPAARIYEAEIEFREGNTRAAYDLYRTIAAQPDAPPFAAERVAQLEETLFNDLVASARAAADTEAVRLLREALSFRPEAIEPRIQLASRLLAQKQFEQARTELEPILNTAADRAEVQEMLAEIEVGRGRFQEAILRYDRLARRTKDPRYEQRLEEIKQEWSAANMPAHFRTARDSESLTRAEFATLLYWTVPAVRFAQNLNSPPIAIDVENVDGREEIIRATAIGLFDVDPVTRRVSPFRPIPASRLASHLARVLTLRGAACARGIPSDRVLEACGVTNPLDTLAPDSPVTGREAIRSLEQVAKALQ